MQAKLVMAVVVGVFASAAWADVSINCKSESRENLNAKTAKLTANDVLDLAGTCDSHVQDILSEVDESDKSDAKLRDVEAMQKTSIEMKEIAFSKGQLVELPSTRVQPPAAAPIKAQ